MESEVTLHLTVRGVVTPEQWRRLQRERRYHRPIDYAVIRRDLAELFRVRLNARSVTIDRIDRKKAGARR